MQVEGRIVAGIRPDEVYALIIALAGTWSPVSATFTATQDDPAAYHERRRAALRGAVARALAPQDARTVAPRRAQRTTSNTVGVAYKGT